MRAVRFVDPSGAVKLGRLEGEVVVRRRPAGRPASCPAREGWAADRRGLRRSPIPPRRCGCCIPRCRGKLIAIGLNYRDHAEESELEIPPVPVVFAKWTTSLTGHRHPIVIPREETRPDYEGEVAVVLGRDVYRADEARRRGRRWAASRPSTTCPAGARQLETPLRQFTLGKSFDTFAPMGPCVARPTASTWPTSTSPPRSTARRCSTRTPGNLIFSIVELIVYLSNGMTLDAGRRDRDRHPGRRRRLPRAAAAICADGDVVDVTVAGVGTLSNTVALER